MKITTQDIIDLLPIVADRGWSQADGMLRDQAEECPLCALANEIDPNFTYTIAAAGAMRVLGIDTSMSGNPDVAAARHIVRAADLADGTQALRNKLRRALKAAA